MSDKEFPSCAYDVCAEFDCEETMALALIATRKELEQSETCCTEWEKQALDYKAKNIGLSGDLERTRKALDVAKDTIRHADWFFDGDYNVDAKTMHNEIKCAIKAITALEQKE